MDNTILMKLFRQFKLGDSLFGGQWKISKDMLHFTGTLSKEEMEEIAIREMVMQLSNKILRENKDIIEMEERETHKEFKCELLILKKEEFKLIVEAAIEMIADEKIQLNKRINYEK